MPVYTVPFPQPRLYRADYSASDGIPYPPWPWPESSIVGKGVWADASDATYTETTAKRRTEDLPGGGFRIITRFDWAWSFLPDDALAGIDPATITGSALVSRVSIPSWRARSDGQRFLWNYAQPNAAAEGDYPGSGNAFPLTGDLTSSALVGYVRPINSTQLANIGLPGHTLGVSPYVQTTVMDHTQPNGDILQGRVYALALQVTTADVATGPPPGVRQYPIHR